MSTPSIGTKVRALFDRRTLKDDATAGVVLGVESVPDGLANGLLAGVNPLAGLYGYLYGTLGGSFFTSSPVMAVQATGAMAIVVADVGLNRWPDPAGALYTLTLLTGVVMILAGLFRLGFLLRFVSTAVMIGFITAVGINIVLGQLDGVTGYAAEGGNRVTRAIDTVLNPGSWDVPSVTVGVVTIVLILWLQRTRLGGLGLVVAIAAGSALALLLESWGQGVETLGDLVNVPNALPLPVLPVLDNLGELIVAALALAFVGLVQGAGVSTAYPPPDGQSDADRDFIGQGAGNILAGFFRGMPVGGSMSASSLNVQAGAKTRLSLMIAAGVMALVILLLADLVALVAMPALAGLLIVVGAQTIKPAQVESIVRTGPIQAVVLFTTLVLTMLIPLQYAVLIGAGLSAILYVVRQSDRVTTVRLVREEAGRVQAVEPPEVVPAGEVVVLQPYGSLFFAAASTFEEQLPSVEPDSRGSVVILRLRGKGDVGSTLIELIKRYSASLQAVGSRFMLVTDSDVIPEQLERTGALDVIGDENVYKGTEWVGETLRKAYEDAQAWVEADREDETAEPEGEAIEEGPVDDAIGDG